MRARPKRWAAATIVLVALIVLVFVRGGGGHAADADDTATPSTGALPTAEPVTTVGAPATAGVSSGGAAQPAPIPVGVWVDTTNVGNPVPQRFLGLSFEVSSLPQIASYARRGDLVNLLRSLGSGILRFGGVSADTQVAWTDATMARPAWANSTLQASQLRELRTLAEASGWPVLLTIGLAHYNVRAAADEAAAARAALGPWLAAIEIGNEPDAYPRHGFRPPQWSYVNYNTEVGRYRRAIAKVAPGLALAGPGVSGSHVFPKWGRAEARRQHPLLLTGHHYPLGCSSGPSIAGLLSGETQTAEQHSLARYLEVAHANSVRFRMDEANTVSCGGRPGISNTFAAALWAVTYIARTMAAGAAGINLEGNPGNCNGYSPVCAETPAELAAGALHPQPEWYALLLMHTLIGERPLRTEVAPTGPPNLAVTALQGAGGRLSFVVADDDPPGSAPAALTLHVGPSFTVASVLSLNAPSPESLSGVTLGGTTVAADGTWQEPAQLPEVQAHEGEISLSVAPSSAALITVR